jgi:hypothetical protein
MQVTHLAWSVLSSDACQASSTSSSQHLSWQQLPHHQHLQLHQPSSVTLASLQNGTQQQQRSTAYFVEPLTAGQSMSTEHELQCSAVCMHLA